MDRNLDIEFLHHFLKLIPNRKASTLDHDDINSH